MNVDTLLSNKINTAIANDDIARALNKYSLIEIGDLKTVKNDVAAMCDLDAAGVYAWTLDDYGFTIVRHDCHGLGGCAAGAAYVRRFIVGSSPDAQSTS